MSKRLITSYLQHNKIVEAKQILEIDALLLWLSRECKLLESDDPQYIWRTRRDQQVRPSHRDNNGKIFRWDKPPDTGHPGEDFNCRCWAEPIKGKQYASQMLISEVNDNSEKWTLEFARHYYLGDGREIALRDTGYLGNVIEYYSETLGKYARVNQQIIDEAKKVGSGGFTYSFNNVYQFNPITVWLAESIVSGVFVGEVRQEGKYLVISGIVAYEYFDDFSDLFQLIEGTELLTILNREESTIFLRDYLGVDVDATGHPYHIRDRWQTKFNATVAII